MKKAKAFAAFLMAFLMIFNLGSALAAPANTADLPQESSDTAEVTFDLLTINWIMRERVVAAVIDMGTEIATSELALDTFTVHCRNNNAAGVMQNQANRNIARIYASNEPEMLDPFQRALPAELPTSGRYVVIELVFWPIAQATAASTGNDSIAFKQVYTITQNKSIKAADNKVIEPGDVTYKQGRTINDVLDRFEYGQAKVGENNPTNYRLFRPDDTSKAQPLVVVQHGGGQGTDNECHLRFQNNSFFAWPEIQEEYPAYVLMPANCTTAAGFDNIKGLIDEMIEDGLVDSNRIYITGHSMGGSATWNFVLRYPELFAAVAPLATAFAATYNEDQAAAIADLPIWEFTTQGDSQGTGAVNMNANWGPHLNNYKYTLLPHNNILEYKGMWYSTPGDANTPGKHGAWLIAYNYYGWNDLPEAEAYPHLVDHERGRLVDWMFAQSKAEAAPAWRLVDPANIELGRSYLIVSEHGALVNASTRISTPGDVTGDTQGGMAAKSVTIENGKVTSEVTPDMIWQFGLGGNNAAASGGLGAGAGYYIRNAAPGEGGGTDPLRRESSMNAQHAPINTTNAGVNVNQQSILLHILDAETKTVGLYIWGGNNAWNFALLGKEDGFTAKSRVASATSAAQLLEQLQESPLWLYEPDVDVGVQHYVMATAGPNGSISPTSPSGHVWVNDGEDVTFTFTPAFGYVVDTVTVNGEAVAVTDNTYTIENVTASDNTIHVTFKFDTSGDITDVPFILYDDIFSIGNVTTAAIIDLGEGKAANLADLSAGAFTVSTRNTRLNGTTLIYEGPRRIARVYVNNEPAPLGYITPAPGSNDLVTETPASGRYIVIEFEFFDANGPLPGAMPSGGLQGTTPAIMNYSINATGMLKLADGSTITPSFIQTGVVNPALDKFVPDKTNPGGSGNMDILISIDESWEDLGPLPLFVYNHGGGRGGSSGEYFAPVQTANGAAVLSKRQLENPGKYNAHLIATQNYGSNEANYTAFMAYVQKLVDEGKVDPNRIYMSGFSAGSMYTVSFYTSHPEFFAGLILNAGGTLPTEAQLIANPELTKVSIWANAHKDDGAGGAWRTTYFTTGGGTSSLWKEINATILQTNQAFNYPYFGFDWTPHETEAQVFSNRISQSNARDRYGSSHEAYADKTIFDWLFDQSRAPEAPKWRLVDPANIELGRSYLIVSEHGALVNASTRISTPGDVTGDTQGGMAAKSVTIENGKVTSEVTPDMIWQFGLGGNNAAASGGLGAGAGYYIRNAAPGEGGGTDPLRRESSMNAQHAPINTTNAGVNVNQQSILLHVLDAETKTVGLYIWGGNNAWNFALLGKEDGFTAKSRVASATSAAQLLEQLQESPLWLYEPDVDVGVQHYVMATAGPNGSISPTSPSGHVWVNDGEDVTFTFTPAFGYVVDTVTVNGEAVAVTDNTYTIENVTASDKAIHVTFKFDTSGDITDVPFILYDDIFSIGNVTTAAIIDLGEGKAANLTDLSAGAFTVSTRNTRLNGTTLIYEGPRRIARVYVNNEPAPLGYITPAPGSNDLVTETPASGRYIVIEFEFFDANGPLPGAMPSGGLQGTTPAIMNYSINATGMLKLADGSTITPSFIQTGVVNPALDKFVPDKTNPGGSGNMDILISIDESWEDLGPLPLFVYNHGGGRGGSSGEYFAPVQTANGAAVLSKLQLENPGKYNAHIIATQNHSNSDANNVALMAYVKKLADEGKVDLNRVYMAGFSMGSMYTVDFYKRYPEFFAAIIPQAGGSLPTVAQLIENPELTKVSMWPHVHKNDGSGTTWTNYFTTGAGASGLYKEANVSVMDTNQAFNFPYYGFDWTPHETEAQLYSNRIGQQNTSFKYGEGHEKYADKNIFDWLFDQSRAAAEPDVTITSTIKTIVAGCAANIPAEVVFAGDPVAFQLGLYNPGGELAGMIDVSADGKYVFKLDAADAVAGTYTIKPVGAADGATITCVEQPADLWAPVVTVNGDTVTITFAAQVSFNASKKSVKLDGAAISNSKVSAVGNAITISGVTVSEGQKLVIAGVKYAELFPSYSFTFTVAIP